MWPFSPRGATYEQVSHLATAVGNLTTTVERMRAYMARTFEEVVADLDTLTTSAADKINAQNALIAELQAAVAAGDQETVDALNAQLTEHVAAMEGVAERLRAIAVDPEDVVPDPSPLPEVEAPIAEEAAPQE